MPETQDTRELAPKTDQSNTERALTILDATKKRILGNEPDEETMKIWEGSVEGTTFLALEGFWKARKMQEEVRHRYPKAAMSNVSGNPIFIEGNDAQEPTIGVGLTGTLLMTLSGGKLSLESPYPSEDFMPNVAKKILIDTTTGATTPSLHAAPERIIRVMFN